MRIFAVEVSLQARHRDPPPSSDLDGRTEPSRATQAVESVGVQTDAPGGFRNRNEIAGRMLSTDLFEPRESRRRSRGHESPSFFGPEGPSLTGSDEPPSSAPSQYSSCGNATGTPRRQVADSARNNFWRSPDRSRSPCGRTRQKFLLGPGLPSPGLDSPPLPVVVAGHANDAAASFAWNATRSMQSSSPCVIRPRLTGSWASTSNFMQRRAAPPVSGPVAGQHSLHHFTDPRLRTPPKSSP